MNISLRAGRPDDAVRCGEICYQAFKAISDKHNFPPDFPSADAAIGLMQWLLGHAGFYSVVAEYNGEIVGSNFVDARSRIAGIGPITVDSHIQDQSIGRHLMADVLAYTAEKGFAGTRLLQATYHSRSLSLYTKLGFATREPLSTMQGTPPGVVIPGHEVRPATLTDLPACNLICHRVHGHDRSGELQDAIQQNTARVVVFDGQIVGYTTLVAFFGHSVALSSDGLKALISTASEYPGPGFHVPTRNTELFSWCLAQGLRVVQPMTLMSIGLYNEPQGAYLPAILY